jgi:hypothetical protein
VAAENVAMERVHDDGRPRIAGQQRCEPADGSRFRRVRVQDRRALAADQPREAHDRARVAEGRDVSVEVVERLDYDFSLLRDGGHPLLAVREHACDERGVVAALAITGYRPWAQARRR